MFVHRLTLAVFSLWVFVACQRPEAVQTEEGLYTAYCGGCHATPDPQHLPKYIWEEHVLPEMAARLGYQYDGYDPLNKYSMEERLHIRETGAYPPAPLIDSATWERLYQWIVDQAPDSLPVDETRELRNAPLTTFEAEPLSLDTVAFSIVTFVGFQEDTREFIVGDAFGKLMSVPGEETMAINYESPVMTYQPGAKTLVTEIGFMNPSDRAWGKVHLVQNGEVETIATGLKRPVYSQSVDLDGDGVEEIVVCEFGNYGGQLSLISASDSSYTRRTLLPVAGTIKFEVEDMDGDGLLDLVVMAAQGNEGIYILYQKPGFSFRTEQVIKLGPEYGSSWFEMVDFDADGDLDIVYANGDNADYSIISKPYHGIRLYENNGRNEYAESWFYPINGATRVLPDDYDLDGDIDLAVLAFFPDFSTSPRESFVFLENIDSDKMLFRAFTFEGALDARWLVMDSGDIDADGDTDLMLGAFMLYPGVKYHQLTDRWLDNGVDLYLLRNKTRSPAN